MALLSFKVFRFQKNMNFPINNAKISLARPSKDTFVLVAEMLAAHAGEKNLLDRKLSLWKRFMQPYSSWADTSVMLKDCKYEKKFSKELVAFCESQNKSKMHVELQYISLAARNRAELISDKSDFYSVGATLVGAILSISLLITQNPILIKWGFAGSYPIILIVYFSIRFKTRKQVADLRVIANILEMVAKRLEENEQEMRE